VIRRLISCSLFAGLGTGVVVGALLVVLPSVRITGGAAATTGSMAVRALLIEGMPSGTALAAPDAWRRCPYLAAVAAGSGCPYLKGLHRGGRCPALPPPAGQALPPGAVPPALEPLPERHRARTVRAALVPDGTTAPAAHPA